MYKTLLQLIEYMKHQLSRNKYEKVIDEICKSEHYIFMYLRDGVTLLMAHDTDNEKYKKLVKDAVRGMKIINSYCENFNYDDIFVFDELDEKSILQCAFDFHDSFKEYTVAKLEDEVLTKECKKNEQKKLL